MNQAAKPDTPAVTEITEAPPKRGFKFNFSALKLNLAQGALALFAVACFVGMAVVLWPQAAGLAGLAFLICFTLTGFLLLLSLTSGRLTPAEAPARLFGAALDADPKPVCITAPDGAGAYVNAGWRRQFGRSPAGGEVLPVA